MTVRFTCPRCGRSSSHPDDLRHGYCGNCHDFTGRVSRYCPYCLDELVPAGEITWADVPEVRRPPDGSYVCVSCLRVLRAGDVGAGRD